MDRLLAWWLNDYLEMLVDEKVTPILEDLADLREQMVILSLTVATSRTTVSPVQKSELVLGYDPHLGKM
jgi:hypothetical protein